MNDGRIHNIVKLYKNELSIFIPKVPINLNRLPDTKKTTEIVRSVDWLEKSINRTHRLLQDYISCNTFSHFFTLTISPDICDRFDDKLVQQHVKNWLDNIRRHSSIGYIIVPERHKNGALHFHGLITDATCLDLFDSKHKDSSGRTIYHTKKYNLGFHDFTKIDNQDAVSQYIRKYISKSFYQGEKNKKRYWVSRNLIKPQVFHNVEGLPIEIEDMIDLDYGFYNRIGL